LAACLVSLKLSPIAIFSCGQPRRLTIKFHAKERKARQENAKVRSRREFLLSHGQLKTAISLSSIKRQKLFVAVSAENRRINQAQ
jgi:hypothetical protein